MPRKPKAKNALSAGERAALYEAEQAEKRAKMQSESDRASVQAEKTRAEQGTAERAKPELPKPQYATVKVDLSMQTGMIKPMHAMCNGPVSYGADISSLFREIGVPYVRFDGTDSAISAHAIDISKIFKDKHADPRNISSYDFTYTDKYVSAAYNSGAKVIFRLGESIDRMGIADCRPLPEDIDTYVEVCANVVRHYNDYFANGYAFGIEYFEIFGFSEEYNDDNDRVFEVYRRIASALKLVDPDLKVGGMCFDAGSGALREFLRYCRKTRSPLDFLTVSSFEGNPSKAADEIKALIPLVHNLGFSSTEIIVGAWSFIDPDAAENYPLKKIMSSGEDKFAEIRRRLFESQRSVKGAAYSLALMISLGKIREISMSCLYDAQPNISPWCAIADRYGNREKAFHAFRAYGEIYRAGREIYTATDDQPGFAHSGIYAAAAEGEEGFYILISSFDGCGIVDLRLDSIPSDIYTADIYMLDGVKDMTLADSLQISGDKKRLILNISRYGAAMVKLY